LKKGLFPQRVLGRLHSYDTAREPVFRKNNRLTTMKVTDSVAHGEQVQAMAQITAVKDPERKLSAGNWPTEMITSLIIQVTFFPLGYVCPDRSLQIGIQRLELYSSLM